MSINYLAFEIANRLPGLTFAERNSTPAVELNNE